MQVLPFVPPHSPFNEVNRVDEAEAAALVPVAVPKREVPERPIEVPEAAVTLPERAVEPEAEAGREVPVLLRELEPDAEAGREVRVLLRVLEPVARVDEPVRTELEEPVPAEDDVPPETELDDSPWLPQVPNWDWQPLPQ